MEGAWRWVECLGGRNWYNLWSMFLSDITWCLCLTLRFSDCCTIFASGASMTRHATMPLSFSLFCHCLPPFLPLSLPQASGGLLRTPLLHTQLVVVIPWDQWFTHTHAQTSPSKQPLSQTHTYTLPHRVTFHTHYRYTAPTTHPPHTPPPPHTCNLHVPSLWFCAFWRVDPRGWCVAILLRAHLTCCTILPTSVFCRCNPFPLTDGLPFI